MKEIIGIGTEIGYYTIRADGGRTKDYRKLWIAECRCGTIKSVMERELLRKDGRGTVSCGCHREERKTKHGMARSPEYEAWRNMKKRCLDESDKSFSHYGERGITICPEWINDFNAFYQHIGLRPGPRYSVERIDNNKGYEPGNVKWATVKEQHRNRRDNRPFTIDGVTKVLTDWLADYNMAWSTVRKRLNKGWDIKRALTTPPNQSFSRDMTKKSEWDMDFELDGESLPLSEWCKRYQIEFRTVQTRLKYGKDLKTALTAPVDKRKARPKAIK